MKLPFETQLKLLFPGFVKEVRFHELRRWRFDFAWPEKKIALEWEGGIYSGGAHTRGKHYESDCEKYSQAAIDGWIVIRATPNLLKDGITWELLAKAFAVREK